MITFDIQPLVVAFITVTIAGGVIANPDEHTWVEPDAWSREYENVKSTNPNCECACEKKVETICPKIERTPTDIENAATLLYYKRLIRLVLNRKYMKKTSSCWYEIGMVLSATKDQLDKLEQAQNPRDLDAVVTDIFSTIQPVRCNGDNVEYEPTDFKALVYNLFRDMFKLINSSEVRFILIWFLLMICGWLFSRRARISYFALVFTGMLLFGYLHTYLECNRKLQVDETIEHLKEREAQKPKPSSLFGYIQSWFVSSDDGNVSTDTIRKLEKSAKIKLGFCRPDDVFIMYFNDIFYKYIIALLNECIVSIKMLSSTLPFPYNLFAAPMLIGAVVYLLKLIIVHIVGPAAWLQIVNRCGNSHFNCSSSTHEDRLSGENLKILLTAVERSNKAPLAVSGVQEVKDAIEYVTKNREDTTQSALKALPTSGTKLKSIIQDVVDTSIVSVEDVPDK